MEMGCVEIYTGEGKGKTTAAFGLALRAAGRGLSVIIMQFFKAKPSGEVLSLERWMQHVTVYRFSSQSKFLNEMSEEEMNLARREVVVGLGMVRKIMESNGCDLLILDEILNAVGYSIIDESQLLNLLESRPGGMEIVLTGRNAGEAIIEKADLVTEFRKIRHPFDSGIGCRKGIEY